MGINFPEDDGMESLRHDEPFSFDLQSMVKEWYRLATFKSGLKKNIHGILRIFVVSMKRSTKQFARALVSSARVLDNTDRAPNFVGRAFSPTENVHRAPHQNVSWIYGTMMPSRRKRSRRSNDGGSSGATTARIL
ncbi:hypothetical protein HZH66_015149 [Vespula vulgaris]|uniref:Uncharacterized protein n=1 Tax=Vespula vulgaris TaxID=7454 RepID=A0A834MMP0_VESVU|nr:hypothetical protein HZH66_015149 [Vespula vulgaris]